MTVKKIAEHATLKVYSNGIATVHDGSSGMTHSVHPNIDCTGSVRGMKQLGYWKRDARTVRAGSYIYNIDSLAYDKENAYDMVAYENCMCMACLERKMKVSKEQSADGIVREEKVSGSATLRVYTSGIATVHDGTSGCIHSVHGNIHISGSVSGMKHLGYWRENDRVARAGDYIYNIDTLIYDKNDACDMIAYKNCDCEACRKRRDVETN